MSGSYQRDVRVYPSVFGIEYAEDLRRLNLSLGSGRISDLAQPGMDIAPMDVLPVIQDGRTLVPVRFISEALDFGVDWNSDTQEVTLEMDGQTLVIAVGETLEGMDVPAQIINDRTMVPLRFVSEFFGATVNFNNNTSVIEIIR